MHGQMYLLLVTVQPPGYDCMHVYSNVYTNYDDAVFAAKRFGDPDGWEYPFADERRFVIEEWTVGSMNPSARYNVDTDGEKKK